MTIDASALLDRSNDLIKKGFSFCHNRILDQTWFLCRSFYGEDQIRLSSHASNEFALRFGVLRKPK
jgi:hypothetical protein